MSTTYCFAIPDISCPMCVQAVTSTLKSRINKTITILDVQVNLSCKQLTVVVNEGGLQADDVMTLLNAELNAIGFPCRKIISHASQVSSNATINTSWLLGFAGVGTGLVLLMLPFVMGPLSSVAMAYIGAASVALTLALGAKSYKKAAALLFNGGYLHMDTLFAVSTLTALTASVAAFFIPGLPMMFEAGLLIFGFRHIGEAIRDSLERRMELKACFQDRPLKIVKKVSVNGVVEDVPIDDITIGDLVLIEAGTMVPVDGVCETGTGLIYTTMDSGSLDPEWLKPTNKLSAGMILETGVIHMRVSAPASQSLLARMDASVNESLKAKETSSWETNADKMLHYFIPTVFALAILSGVIAGFFFSAAMAIQCIVAVLVSACPCTLGLVTGVAVQVGMKKAADHDMVFKSTKKLEEVNEIQHVVFDLHGTLTTSTPIVTSFKPLMCTEEAFFKYLVMIEEHSKKAMGMAIYKYALNKATGAVIRLTKNAIDDTNISGLKATINDENYVVGDAQMMRDNEIPLDETIPLSLDETIIYLACGKAVLGHLILQRPLRREAGAVINALIKMGKQVHICTGAEEHSAMRYGRRLGIPVEHLHCKMSPGGKVDYIATLQKNGARVAMIGDEENDSPAIAKSDFGVAMPTDGDVNTTGRLADAESKINSLYSIVAAFEVSQQTATNIQQNLMFSLSYNLAAMLLPVSLLFATGIALSPGVGVVLMILQTSLILLNTERFKRQDLLYLKQAREEGRAVIGESSYSLINSLTSIPDYQAAPPLAPTPASGRLAVNRDTNIPCVLNSEGFANSHL